MRLVVAQETAERYCPAAPYGERSTLMESDYFYNCIALSVGVPDCRSGQRSVKPPRKHGGSSPPAPITGPNPGM